MTPLQEYCKVNGHLKIKETFGIYTYEHPTLPLIGFKYNQIESPKTDKVVRYSRGTILHKDSYDLIGQSFIRFFNYGEHLEEMKAFNWGNFTVTEKCDGSLAIVYNFDNKWHMNTSGSFGLGKINTWSDYTWQSLFWETAAKGGLKGLNPEFTYIFELCSMHNKVVRIYPTPKVFLLSVFCGENELSPEQVKEEGLRINATMPESYHFSSLNDIEVFLSNKEKEDSSFEGVVIRDNNGIRFKIKSKTYLALHRLADNGNIANPANFVPLILAGETSEVLCYFPELKDKFKEVQAELDIEYFKMSDLWEKNKDAITQKDFALAVKDAKFAGLLFQMKKNSNLDLKKLWLENGELIAKKLYGNFKSKAPPVFYTDP